MKSIPENDSDCTNDLGHDLDAPRKPETKSDVPYYAFADRPPGELPKGTVHVAEGYRDWWEEQSGRREKKPETFTVSGKTYRERRPDEPRYPSRAAEFRAVQGWRAPIDKRAWAPSSARVVPMVNVIPGPAPKAARCAYTYFNEDHDAVVVRDCVGAIEISAKQHIAPPVHEDEERRQHPKLDVAITAEEKRREAQIAIWNEYLDEITPNVEGLPSLTPSRGRLEGVAA